MKEVGEENADISIKGRGGRKKRLPFRDAKEKERKNGKIGGGDINFSNGIVTSQTLNWAQPKKRSGVKFLRFFSVRLGRARCLRKKTWGGGEGELLIASHGALCSFSFLHDDGGEEGFAVVSEERNFSEKES